MKKTILVILSIVFMSVHSLNAQEAADDQPLTQEEFAVELVKLLEVEEFLPKAAIPSDCVALLEKFGIAPLKGWDNKALLKREDYLVLIGKARGQGDVVHKRAIQVEQKNIEVINTKWEENYQETNNWLTLTELLNDSTIFPDGPPVSPYGHAYQDKNGDHKVDQPFMPLAHLLKSE